MQIVLKSITNPEWKSKGKAKWQEVVMSYTSDKGDKDKKFLSFDPIYAKITGLEVGCTYDVRLEKDGDFYKWVEVEKVEGAALAAPSKPAGGQSGNTWVDRTALDRERFEFDKEKQILIIRQSMIAAAVSRLGTGNGNVFELADAFIHYVNTGEHPDGASEEKRPRGRPRKEGPVEPDEPDIE